ncbi:MAG: YifB family Mg chelatase-like AAA ATPase [Eubacteriales bacterium]|jgi:magnesium chelatase family protein
MYARINSCGLWGVDGSPVTVEARFSAGLPAFDMVGLPDPAVKESRERVRSALAACDLPLPSHRITVNLAPADIKKEGPLYDLPILLALLCGQQLLSWEALGSSVFVGELALDGSVRPVRGVMSMALTALQQGFSTLYVPAANAAEAGAVPGLTVYGVEHLRQLLDHLRGTHPLSPTHTLWKDSEEQALAGQLDFLHVKGQPGAVRGALIGAAGFHNLLLIGPPGSGKSMIARRLRTILPPMELSEVLETTRIHSVAGLTDQQHPLVTTRPFRSPHHTISAAGLAGGGSSPRPGEVSLAHHGVLFLDELPEFSKNALEILRQPLEEGRITLSRASGSVSYPCRFMLVCAMNPCRCGYLGHPTRRCSCSEESVRRYLGKISGPLLDRIDLHIEVPPVRFEDLTAPASEGVSSAQLLQQVRSAREMQKKRYEKFSVRCNAHLTPDLVQQLCPLESDVRRLLQNAFEKFSLSARAYDKIIKISRTIADLEQSEIIRKEHLLEALQYRNLDRKYWGA